MILALILLAGEAIGLDRDLQPRFTPHQIAATSDSTREGFTRWAHTSEGRAILKHLQDRTVFVVEDSNELSAGRAPQPSLGQMLSKQYELILNPSIAAQYHTAPDEIDLGLPRTPADVMALAWAGEMLHIDFYAEGISLPHHARADFQARWLAVAGQLGLPNTPHGGEEEGRRPRVLRLR